MKRVIKNKGPWVCAALVVSTLLVSGCGTALKQPRIAVNLPEKYNTPDGMTLEAGGNIILSVPNLNNSDYPAKLLKIDRNNRLSELITMPAHPQTGKAGPLGVDVGSDGNLYVADYQESQPGKALSRLVRVVMRNGKAVKAEVVVEGLNHANGVACRGDSVFVTDSRLEIGASPMPSGVYRFDIDELDAANPVKVVPGGQDKHLITKFYTKNKEFGVGANGICFDDVGYMYVANFGDAQVLRYLLDENGDVLVKEVFAKGGGMKSCDGIRADSRSGYLYVADFLGNAIHRIDTLSGKVTTIAKNDITDGTGGKLDRPSEVCVRGDKLYIANIDLPLADNKFDKPHTISVIDLGE